jgi:hypothetical protein
MYLSIPFVSVSSRKSLSEKNRHQITLHYFLSFHFFICFLRIFFSKVIFFKYIPTSFRVYYLISWVFQEFSIREPSPSNVRHSFISCLFFLSVRLCRIKLSEVTNMMNLIEDIINLCVVYRKSFLLGKKHYLKEHTQTHTHTHTYTHLVYT